MKQWLLKWLGCLTVDMLREYNETVVADSFKALEIRLTKTLEEIQVLRLALKDVQDNVQLLVNENIELRKNLPNKPPRQARNFTEFRTMLEAAQQETGAKYGSETV